jgi:RND family efflux transporter MFP subunit
MTKYKQRSISPWRFLLLLIVLIGAVAASAYLLNHKPRAVRKAVEPVIPLVQVMTLQTTDHLTRIHAMGIVVASQSVNLSPRVSGEIIKRSSKFYPGGMVQAEEEMLRIDPEDYRLVVKQRESDVIKAKNDLQLEQGRQASTKKEYELTKKEYKQFGEPLKGAALDLVLRKPYLKLAKASVKAAEASLKKAKLDLSRTSIHAPFNALVQSIHVAKGSQVTTATTLATLVASDTYWIEVSLPADQMRWIHIPQNGAGAASDVRISHSSGWSEQAFRPGRVKSLRPDIEAQGLMARLMVEVQDPLSLKKPNAGKPVLLLGSHVQLGIEGKKLVDVFSIPRLALHDGNQVWLLKQDGTLDIRKLEIMWTEQNNVFVRQQLKNGERLIISNLAAPVQGMRLRQSSADQPTVRK